MARVQLVMSDDDRNCFVDQARREGMSLSAWLRAAARERIEARQSVERFKSSEDLKRFFRKCSEREGPGAEPDWEEHLQTLHESITGRLPSA